MKAPARHSGTFLWNGVRVVLLAASGAALLVLVPRIESFGDALIYAASWIILAHVCIGLYVFSRLPGARVASQGVLDLLGGGLLLAAMLSFPSSARWCGLLGGAFALAIMKYVLLARRTPPGPVRTYIAAKIRWEAPSVPGFLVLAVVFRRLPEGEATLLLEGGVLAAAAGFAIYMILVRRIYSQKPGNA